jgi:hypothetical protein
MDTVNQTFLQATCWSISPATGNDENAGWGLDSATADSHPLRTMGELNRRLFGYHQNNAVAAFPGLGIDVHVMDDLDASSFAILSNLSQPNAQKFMRIRGTLRAVDGTSSNLPVSGYTAAVPATNGERHLVLAGVGTKPTWVGKMIQTTDGLKTAFITRQLSANTFAISQVFNGGSTFDGATASGPADFANGDRVNILDAARIPCWPFPGDAVIYPLLAQCRIGAATTGLFPTANLGSSQPFLTQCFLGDGVSGETEFDFSGGHGTVITSCAIFATHANEFRDGSGGWFGVAILISGDGPFISNYDLGIGNEASFVPLAGTAGGTGVRNGGEQACRISVGDDGIIASFGMNNATFVLLSTHVGIPGDFAGSDSGIGHSLWYGSGNSTHFLVLGQGTRSKFPKIGFTAVTSADHEINLAGRGLGDTDNNFRFSDIPIIDLSSLAMLGDSTPTRY